MKLINTYTPAQMPTSTNQTYLPGTQAPEMRNGSFELLVGKKTDVDAYLTKKKQMHDPVGQLSLNSNVVESAINFEYIPPNTHVLNTLLPYINLNQRTRNGAPGNDAAFVYPLKAPTNKPPSDQPVHLGLYIDNADLDGFLNYVGSDKWSSTVKTSPDKVTQFALEYAEAVGTDANKNPIILRDVSQHSPSLSTAGQPTYPNNERSGMGFLDLFA